MGIEARHHYHFSYLKSEQWKTVRLEALVREKGKCQICGEESISNDAHHMWYPEHLRDTTPDQLVILCRICHEFIHAMIPECKTSDEGKGRAHWQKFYNAIKVWHAAKCGVFGEVEIRPEKVPALRKAYNELKAVNSEQAKTLDLYREQFGPLKFRGLTDSPSLCERLQS